MCRGIICVVVHMYNVAIASSQKSVKLVSVVNPYTLCDQIALDWQHSTVVVTGELLSLV